MCTGSCIHYAGCGHKLVTYTSHCALAKTAQHWLSTTRPTHSPLAPTLGLARTPDAVPATSSFVPEIYRSPTPTHTREVSKKSTMRAAADRIVRQKASAPSTDAQGQDDVQLTGCPNPIGRTTKTPGFCSPACEHADRLAEAEKLVSCVAGEVQGLAGWNVPTWREQRATRLREEMQLAEQAVGVADKSGLKRTGAIRKGRCGRVGGGEEVRRSFAQ